MDIAQQFCLRWNNYQSTLHHVFHKLWTNKVFVDVSLVVESKKIECHKVILSACSTYFEQLLSEHSSHPHPLILLHDIPFTAVESLVTFMYKGEINVSHDQLTALLKVAESLKIKGLADSAAISNFTKYRLLSPDITKITTTPYSQPMQPVSVPVQLPVPTTFLPTSNENTGARCYSLPVHKPTHLVGSTKRPESLVNGPNPPPKKRLRHEELVESLPPSPPISLGDSYNNEQARTSPKNMKQEVKQEPDDESDNELQIDETVGRSPSEPASSDTLSNRNTPVLETDHQDLVERHETAQSLAALACQGAINLLPHLPQQNLLAPKPLKPQLPIKEERSLSNGGGGGKNAERSYTLQDLEDGIESVLKGHLTPAKAIARYRVPRRTFFRRLSAVRKSRGIPSSKENSSELVNSTGLNISTSEVRNQDSLVVPGLMSTNSSYPPALNKISRQGTEDTKKEKKPQGLNLNSGNVFSLLNVAANPSYDYYFKYLKLAQAKDLSDDKKETHIVDGNRNLASEISEQALALVQQNGTLK